MSIPVSLENLRTEISKFVAHPYLLTVSDDGRPHCVSVSASWDGDVMKVKCGSRTRANAAARPMVSLLWSPNEAGGYSLIMDAEGSVEGSDADALVVVRPSRAVLHRPAAGPVAPGASCSDDCVPLLR